MGPAGGRGHQGGEEETLGLAECAPAGQGTGMDAGEELSLGFGRPGGEGGRGKEVCVTLQPRVTHRASLDADLSPTGQQRWNPRGIREGEVLTPASAAQMGTALVLQIWHYQCI